jgi:mono/diheme cytochrome c family protein
MSDASGSHSPNGGNNHDNDDHYNRGGLIAFLFAMSFALCFFAYIAFVHPGVDLKENIQAVQAVNAGVLAEVDVSKVKEPWVSNPDMVARGKKVFAQNCATCHGAEGRGDGAAGQALNPKPRNLVEGPWKKGGGYVGWFTVLQNGLPPSSMVSFKHLAKTDRWALVQFIDSITNAKVKEDPKAVAEFAKTAD